MSEMDQIYIGLCILGIGLTWKVAREGLRIVQNLKQKLDTYQRATQQLIAKTAEISIKIHEEAVKVEDLHTEIKTLEENIKLKEKKIGEMKKKLGKRRLTYRMDL